MIYLDYNATHPIRAEVRAGVEPFLGRRYGNPSSPHAAGREVREPIEAVRRLLLEALGDPGGEIVFTSGGTEANNLALAGLLRPALREGRHPHLVVSSVEHSSVLQAARALAREGASLTEIPVDPEGRVDLQALAASITPQTCLISVMHANNEVGTLQPAAEAAGIARQRRIPFHTDAVQSFGKVPFDLRRVPADLVSLSGHKLGGVKGTGALYFKRGLAVQPLLFGGPHERGFRAGTENVPGIVAMGIAARESLRELAEGKMEEVRRLRDWLEEGILARVPGARVNGQRAGRLPGTSNVSFPGCRGETLLMALDMASLSVSTGSACSSGSTEPSHVLRAMGLPEERIEGSIRFSMGAETTEAEIREALRLIPEVVERVRRAGVEAA